MIAIDGPAGSGKSTVAGLLAERLDLALLDTGAMYRAAGLAVVRAGVSVDDREGVIRVVQGAKIDLSEDSPNKVFLDGEEITGEIRTLEVGQAASQVSTISEVRKHLVALQQEIVARGGRVLEGRDVTTVVAPDADVKVFLTASIEERAKRRWLETKEQGSGDSLQDVVKDVVIRDHRDYTRDDSPLMLAEDAVIIESFGITPEDVVDQIVELVEKL